MLFSGACKFSEVYCSDLESTDYAAWFRALKKQSVWAAVKFLQNKQTRKPAFCTSSYCIISPWFQFQDDSGKSTQFRELKKTGLTFKWCLTECLMILNFHKIFWWVNASRNNKCNGPVVYSAAWRLHTKECKKVHFKHSYYTGLCFP